MQKYSVSQEINFYVNFLDLEGKECTTITDAKITIRHVNSSGVTIVDLDAQPLTYAIETLYYYKHIFPLNADLGIYTIEFSGICDLEYAEANSQFELMPFTGDEICEYTLTTAQLVADYLGVDSSNIKEDWIEWISYYIESYTQVSFCPKTVKEKYDIDELGQSVLMLDNYPLIELVEVVNNGTVMNLNDILTYEDEGYIKLDDSYAVGSGILNTGSFVRGRQKVHVTYKYGYSSLPKDIEWAATVLTSSIAITSLTQSGVVSVGDVVEEEIGNYRRKKSIDENGEQSFSMNLDSSKKLNGRLEEDVFSAKNVLRMYRSRGMRAI